MTERWSGIAQGTDVRQVFSEFNGTPVSCPIVTVVSGDVSAVSYQSNSTIGTPSFYFYGFTVDQQNILDRAVASVLQRSASDPAFMASGYGQALTFAYTNGISFHTLAIAAGQSFQGGQWIQIGGRALPYSQDQSDLQVETVVVAGGEMTDEWTQIELVNRAFHEQLHISNGHREVFYDPNRSILQNLAVEITAAFLRQNDPTYRDTEILLNSIKQQMGWSQSTLDEYFLNLFQSYAGTAAGNQQKYIALDVATALTDATITLDAATIGALVTTGYIEAKPGVFDGLSGAALATAQANEGNYVLTARSLARIQPRPSFEQCPIVVASDPYGDVWISRAGVVDAVREFALNLVRSFEAGVRGSLRLDTSDLFGSIGQVLGREIAGDNPFAQLVVSSTLQSVLTNLGEWMESNGFPGQAGAARFRLSACCAHSSRASATSSTCWA